MNFISLSVISILLLSFTKTFESKTRGSQNANPAATRDPEAPAIIKAARDPGEAPAELNFLIKESQRRATFDKLWAELEMEIASQDYDMGPGHLPVFESGFSDDMKMMRYMDNFVPAYNKIVFLPRFPYVTGVNFFALLR